MEERIRLVRELNRRSGVLEFAAETDPERTRTIVDSHARMLEDGLDGTMKKLAGILGVTEEGLTVQLCEEALQKLGFGGWCDRQGKTEVDRIAGDMKWESSGGRAMRFPLCRGFALDSGRIVRWSREHWGGADRVPRSGVPADRPELLERPA